MTKLQLFQMLAAMDDKQLVKFAADIGLTQKPAPNPESMSDFRERVVDFFS